MNKQIEEMAKDLEEIEKEQGHKLLNETLLYVNKNHRYNLKEDYSLAHKKTIYELTAEELINLGYQKVDKDSIILSKEQYIDLTLAKQSIFNMLEERDNKARKETAREILTIIGNMLDECDDRFKLKDYQWHKDLCKQYGVEIKE